MFPNDADGNAFRDGWPALISRPGTRCVDGGAYADGTTDYTLDDLQVQEPRTARSSSTPRCRRTSTRSGSRPRSRATSPSSRPWPRCCCSRPTPRRSATWSINIATDSLVGPVHALQVVADRRDEPSSSPTRTRRRPASSGSRRSAPPTRCSRSRRSRFTAATDPHDTDAVAAAAVQGELHRDVRAARLHAGGPVPRASASCRPVGVQWKQGHQSSLGDGGRRQQPQPGRARSAGTCSRRTPELGRAPLLELDARHANGSDRSRSPRTCRSRVGAGEPLGIVGPNGAGKTSLFGMISRRPRPGSRRGPLRRAAGHAPRRGPRALPARHRPHLPGPAAVQRDDRVRERARRRAAGRWRDAAGRATTRRLRVLERNRARRRRQPAGRAARPALTASAWSWPGRSPPGRACCCSTRSPAA